MAKYIMAVDQGTTSTRALLFDKEGQLKAKAQTEFPQHYPQPGWCEHDPMDILNTVVKCCEDVLKQASATKADVAGIGITNQRETSIAWDATTGEALYHAIVWLDLRTDDIVHKLSKSGGKDRFRKKTGLPLATYFSAMKMRWMLENVEAVKKAADEGRCRFGTVESWLIYKLTGGKDGGVHVTDVSNASRYMLMNLKTLAWDEAVCKAIGIPMATLPEIRSNSEIYGEVKSIPALEGVPVSGALGDQHAALLGQGCLEIGASKNTYGTGCFMLMNTGKDPVPSRSGLLTTIGYKLGKDVPTTFALEGSVACAGRSVQWLRDNLKVIDEAAQVEERAASVEDTGGVTIVPAFSGLFAPYWRDDARAVAVGMTLFTTREHLCRATLEAVAFQTVDVMQAMKKDTGKQLSSMRVDGGMTANNLLMQIQADLLGVPVLRAHMPEATCLGAALAAGLGVGFYSEVGQVAGFLEKAGGHETFSPAMEEKERIRSLKRWKDAVDRSYGLDVWEKKVDDKPALRKPRFKKVSSIKPESQGLNLLVRVVRVPEGSTAATGLQDAVCGDATGVVTLRLEPQELALCEQGSYVRVQNARAEMVSGFIRVRVGKWGIVAKEEPPEAFEANLANDISAVEYELSSKL